jgi:hypothetical protein
VNDVFVDLAAAAVHVEHIRVKLGVHSRAQVAAAWVVGSSDARA